jgi:hypothetical protein
MVSECVFVQFRSFAVAVFVPQATPFVVRLAGIKAVHIDNNESWYAGLWYMYVSVLVISYDLINCHLYNSL